MKNNWIEEFIETGADLEHERWSGWQKYLHSLCVKNKDGTLTIPKERVERWERQIATHYSELSEQEKEYDRIEVRKYLPRVESLLAEQKKELLLEVRTYIGDLDYEDMHTKSINEWVDEFIKFKGITL